ncbi:MAG: type II toxin-antitoxin system HicA family toxin [Spirochaetota bacterium]
MQNKHRKTLEAIFKKSAQANIEWKNVEALLITLGAEISEGNGSRIRIKLNNVRAVFHRPHPQKETDKGSIASMCKFLENAGIKP